MCVLSTYKKHFGTHISHIDGDLFNFCYSSDCQVTGKIVTFYCNKQKAYCKLNIAINIRLHLVQISNVCFFTMWVATMNGWLIKNPTVNQNSSQKSKIPQKFLIHRNDNCRRCLKHRAQMLPTAVSFMVFCCNVPALKTETKMSLWMSIGWQALSFYDFFHSWPLRLQP